ncbi:hypothetical protein ABN063_19685 [Providencia vermicola]|uniref:hypothetical protein n=1 Tax=Providencia vermicola TaxID=333965 RepID=UPI0032D9EAFA
MEKINKILDVLIKLITLSTFFIVFLSFISYYWVLNQYDLISVMIDNGFDYIKILPMIIQGLTVIFSFVILFEGVVFFLSSVSKDTHLISLENKKITYDKIYILCVSLIFILSCLLFYFILIPFDVDSDYFIVYISLLIFVFSGAFSLWYYRESNKMSAIINLKYKNNYFGTFIVFSSIFGVCFLLFFLSFILFIIFESNKNENFYLAMVFSIILFVVVNYIANLRVLNDFENKTKRLYGFFYKLFASLFFVFLFGFSLTNVIYFFNQQSYSKAGYIIMNDYKYNFENGIPDNFLIHDVKVNDSKERRESMNYGFENLKIHSYLECVPFKECDNDILGNNIEIIQWLISVVETKNNIASVLGVFEINSKTLICPKKLGVDIQDERRLIFGFNFRIKKINYKKECLFVDNKDLIN